MKKSLVVTALIFFLVGCSDQNEPATISTTSDVKENNMTESKEEITKEDNSQAELTTFKAKFDEAQKVENLDEKINLLETIRKEIPNNDHTISLIEEIDSTIETTNQEKNNQWKTLYSDFLNHRVNVFGGFHKQVDFEYQPGVVFADIIDFEHDQTPELYFTFISRHDFEKSDWDRLMFNEEIWSVKDGQLHAIHSGSYPINSHYTDLWNLVLSEGKDGNYYLKHEHYGGREVHDYDSKFRTVKNNELVLVDHLFRQEGYEPIYNEDRTEFIEEREVRDFYIYESQVDEETYRSKYNQYEYGKLFNVNIGDYNMYVDELTPSPESSIAKVLDELK